ncbi:hypothetical protein DFJ73DRAFT_802564 [Zopfochytrium polystomum]|nr:hypothetical protein DFJ73DRAFT_802564 [Zopfochytrium polystomum]
MAQLLASLDALFASHPAGTLVDLGISPPTASASTADRAEEPAGSFHPFIVVEGNLGIPADVVEPLFRHAHAAFFLARARRRPALDGIPRFPYRRPGTHSGSNDDEDDAVAALLASASRALALINPELYTTWNVRRDLVLAGRIRAQEEVGLIDLILTRHPKRGTLWNYRTWLTEQLIAEARKATGESTSVAAILAHEWTVCTRACDRHRMNYNAWTHRLKLLAHVGDAATARGEVARVGVWLRRNVSDHSGFAYRLSAVGRLRELLIAERAAVAAAAADQRNAGEMDDEAVVGEEVRWAKGFVVEFAGHASAWNYLACTIWCEVERRGKASGWNTWTVQDVETAVFQQPLTDAVAAATTASGQVDIFLEIVAETYLAT